MNSMEAVPGHSARPHGLWRNQARNSAPTHVGFQHSAVPEILISEQRVMAEGVDLHRFCRYVIHHDLCWNPRTLEQRPGAGSNRCRAEKCEAVRFDIYHAYAAATPGREDVPRRRDRERWFQIVMGQKFEFDEKTSEDLARRIPLPEALAKSLIFDLRRFRQDSESN